MATIHEPPQKVRPSVPEPEQKMDPVLDPVAEDRKKTRSDRIHATIVLLAVVAVFALIILLATLSPPPDGAEFQPWMMP
ncbi:MAG: hypothetical protein V3R99_02080 [Thermoguttaceae bacterium]